MKGCGFGKKCKLKDIALNFDEASQMRKASCERENWLPASVSI